MKSVHSQQHKVDLLFPFALFFVFLMSALSTLLLAANLYEKITDDSARTNNAGIAMSYLQEKIRQNDSYSSVNVTWLEDTQALVIQHPQLDYQYCTYIYCYDGFLRELMVNQSLPPSPTQGRSILPLKSLQAEMPSPRLLEISCEDSESHRSTIHVSLLSGKE